MNTQFNNTVPSVALGTQRQGYVQATFEQMVEIFGEPDDRDDDKTTTEWTCVFSDGLVFTIYDYCVSGCRDGREFGWHIGGHDSAVSDRVRDLVADQ